MSLSINIRHLHDKNLSLQGEIAAETLGLETLDELIHLSKPLIYNLEAQKLDHNILVQGTLEVLLDCECARCLKPYQHPVRLEGWMCHIPLEGDEKALIINDCLDLTPYVREDIILAFPQHPLCKPDCVGLPGASPSPDQETDGERNSTSAWAELNKLKFEE